MILMIFQLIQSNNAKCALDEALFLHCLGRIEDHVVS